MCSQSSASAASETRDHWCESLGSIFSATWGGWSCHVQSKQEASVSYYEWGERAPTLGPQTQQFIKPREALDQLPDVLRKVRLLKAVLVSSLTSKLPLCPS